MKALIINSLFFLVFVSVVVSSPYVLTFQDPTTNEAIPQTVRPLLGARKCTRGPAYWCHNITQAKECGAVKHCISRVWEPMKLPADNDTICDICKEMVKEARDQLLSNETQDELRQVFEGSCNLIPVELIASECRKFVDEFIPELIDTLASRMDPQVVCAVSGLCNSVRIDEMLAKMKEIKENLPIFDLQKDSCPKCTYYIGEAISSIKKLSKEELLNKIFEICGHLGSYSDSCIAIAMEEINALYEVVQNQLDATELCGLFGLSEVVAIHPLFSSASNPAPLWTILTPGEAPLTKLLPAEKMTGEEERNSHQPGLFYPMTELLPADILTGDDERKTHQPGFSYPMTELLPADILTGDEEQKTHQPEFTYSMTPLTPADILTGYGGQTLVVAKKGVTDILPTCGICIFTVTKLIELIGHNITKESIDNAMDKVCNLVPVSHRAGCETFMDEYGKKVAEMIVLEGSAHVICTALHLCLFSPNPPMTTLIQKPIKLIGVADLPFDRYIPFITGGPVEWNMQCALCEFILNQIDLQLRNNETDRQIIDTVEQICRYLPRIVRDECKQFIDYYGQEIIEYLEQEMDPKEICTKIGLCHNKMTPMVPFEMIMDNNIKTDRCQLCMLISNYLSVFLDDPFVDTSIDKLIERVCRLVPSAHEMECQELVEDYGPYLLSLLAQAADKGEACAAVDLCPAPTTTTTTSTAAP